MMMMIIIIIIAAAVCAGDAERGWDKKLPISECCKLAPNNYKKKQWLNGERDSLGIMQEIEL